MSYELLIAEKPNAADRISASIAEGKRVVKSVKSVKYYEVTRNGKTIVVVPAVGHIFGLKQKSGGWTYPIFDVEWLPTFKISKDAAYVRNYYDTLKALAKDADSFVVGCDYDIEGEVIAYNILRFICKVEDAKRMKYSTLTKAELENSYDHASPHIEKSLADAGVTRHILDYYFGINISRALTLAMKSAGRYKIMSSGRVQGPTLKILADKELAIKAFKSTPFWQIELEAKDFTALYENEKIISQSSKLFEQGSKIEKEADAKKIVDECKGKDAIVSKIEKKTLKHSPPEPFNLTDLQAEAYRVFKISPKTTQEIAQKLYEAALVSYPRTSSQKLPAVLNLKGILEKLAKQPEYSGIAKAVLSRKTLAPNEGQKTDEAHPAIHPTGEIPRALNPLEKKIYDLVVKRFISTFGDAAIKESISAKLNIGPHIFNAAGKRTVEANWYSLYAPYSNNKEVILPPLTDGQRIDVKKLNLLAKETEPPRRYTPASIIREMERLNIGTKATRAEIVNNLVLRGYIKGTPIEVSDLGLKTNTVLEKYLPQIVSVELTRRFEEEIEEIEKGKRTPGNVLKEAENELTSELSKFRAKEKEVGGALLLALNETAAADNIVGICPTCGGDLRVIVSKMTKKRFVGCSGYAGGCRTSYPLPQAGLLKTTKETCRECGSPIVKIISKGKKPWQLCIDPKCKTKDAWNNKAKTTSPANPAPAKS